MRKLLVVATLAFAFALSMTVVPTTALANSTWFKTHNPGAWVDIYSKPGYRQGKLRCRIPHGDFVKTASVWAGGSNNVNVLGTVYYHVSWQRKLGTMEWHWRDGMTNGWCPHWNRSGWANSNLLRKTDKPGGLWIN